MKRFSTSAFRTLFMVSLVLTLFLVLVFYDDERIPFMVRDGFATSGQTPFVKADEDKTRPVVERLDLSEKECRAYFPDLYKEFSYAAKAAKFVLKKDEGDYQGLVQGWIKNNKLYILTTAPDTVDQILHQRTAILSQLHRALLTSPTPLPDTPFAFAVNDNPRNNSWAFARPNKQTDYNLFLMPSFAFWSWPTPTLGAFPQILTRISLTERTHPWPKKTDKAVWRGTPWFNPLGYPTLRQDLLKATQRRAWADVAALKKNEKNTPGNALAIEDFCAYKYVVYTEGVTYSGRLPYHQACESVLITAPLTYLTSTAWLVKPIAAGALLAAFGSGGGETAGDKDKGKGDASEGRPVPLLETVRDWREANAVYVSPKFEDLEDVVRLLRARPEVARRIARNQREGVVGRGYLSEAAETCYWRALVRAWAGSVIVGDEWAAEMGERYETWLLKQVSGTHGRARGRVGG